MPGIDLTTIQRDVLRAVFARHAGKLDSVAVYGSRAQGRAFPGSDIDLVLIGPVAAFDIGAIRTDLEESDLSIFADVIALEDVSHPGLRREIERWMKPLFSRGDLAPK